jgi:hypothetical protein
MIGALWAFFLFFWKYAHETHRSRIEWFIKLGKEFRTKKKFDPIFEFLDLEEPKELDLEQPKRTEDRSSIDFKTQIPEMKLRYQFAAFLDDIAMCVNAGVIQPDVANYTFGYYVQKIFDTGTAWSKMKHEAFWSGIDDDYYCELLKKFEVSAKLKILNCATIQKRR